MKGQSWLLLFLLTGAVLLLADRKLPSPLNATPAWPNPSIRPAAALPSAGVDQHQSLTTCADFLDPLGVGVEDLRASAQRWDLSADNPDPDDNPLTPNYEPRFDLDSNGVIAMLDLMQVSAQMGQTCRPGAMIIQEVMPSGDGGQAPWVELTNHGAAAIPLQAGVLTDGDTFSYTIPSALPDVPGGAFVLLQFDGLGPGADDYDFSDQLATLHSSAPLTQPFAAAGDQLALFHPADPLPENLHAFVAWGVTPNAQAAMAEAANRWPDDAYARLGRGGLTADASVPGESIGLYPDQAANIPDNWGVYGVTETTPGAANAPPSPRRAIRLSIMSIYPSCC